LTLQGSSPLSSNALTTLVTTSREERKIERLPVAPLVGGSGTRAGYEEVTRVNSSDDDDRVDHRDEPAESRVPGKRVPIHDWCRVRKFLLLLEASVVLTRNDAAAVFVSGLIMAGDICFGRES
jgi:hypothetical protein